MVYRKASPLTREAWIEMRIAFCCNRSCSRRLSHERRGLKLIWIIILLDLLSRLSHERRGLKFFYGHNNLFHFHLSPLTREAWIEIGLFYTNVA